MRKQTIDRIRKFTKDRDWDQFHTPANLAKSISIEASELLECFQWSDTDYDLEHVKEELADVIVYCQDMLDKLGLDVDEIVNSKMKKNEKKYPIEKSKGSSKKYDELGDDTYDFDLIKRSLEPYLLSISYAQNLDLTENGPYQMTFNYFFKIRRDENWRKIYYGLMNETKDNNYNFEYIIKYLYEKTGRIEASFSSKLLAALDPNKPIWDQYILNNLNIDSPHQPNKEERINSIIIKYNQICDWYNSFLNTIEAIEMIQLFDSKFPNYTSITPTKKIDFLLWSKR